MYVYIRVHAFASARGITHSCSFGAFVLRQNHSLAWAGISLNRLCWLEIHLSDFPALGSQHMLPCLTCWSRVLGIKLRPLCLQGQQFYHFTNCAVSPVSIPSLKSVFIILHICVWVWVHMGVLTYMWKSEDNFQKFAFFCVNLRNQTQFISLGGKYLNTLSCLTLLPIFLPPPPPKKKLKTKNNY